MPIFQYKCDKCGTVTEEIVRPSEVEPTKHADCDGNLARQIAASNFQLKGTGWYKSDYKGVFHPTKK